jgi:short-subunit dehydrogenase
MIQLPGGSAYNASKHAVVAMSETLYNELHDMDITNVGISVLCPAFVPTGISNSARVRPAELSDSIPHSGQGAKYAAGLVKAVKSGKISADKIAEITFKAIQDKQLYILPHEKIGELVVENAVNIANQQNPTFENISKLTTPKKK